MLTIRIKPLHSDLCDLAQLIEQHTYKAGILDTNPTKDMIFFRPVVIFSPFLKLRNTTVMVLSALLIICSGIQTESMYMSCQSIALIEERSHLWACCIKVAEHSFQEPIPNSPLLLSYLSFGARFLQESRLTIEEFILEFWLRCELFPWQQG